METAFTLALLNYFLKIAIKQITYIFTFVLFSASLMAQNTGRLDTLVSSYIERLTQLWNENKNHNFSEYITDPYAATSDRQFPGQYKQSVLSSDNGKQSLLLTRNQLRQNILKKDYGFSLNGGYQENLSAPFVSPDEALVFRRKFSIGVDWDLLKGGLLDNKNAIKKLQQERIQLDAARQHKHISQSTLAHYSFIIQNFNRLKLSIIRFRIKMMQQQNDIARQLWVLKQITGDAFLTSNRHLTDSRSQYYLFDTYNKDFSLLRNDSINTIVPFLADIDYGRLLRATDSITELNRQGDITTQALPQHKYHYYEDISLKAYTRYNYYDVFNPGNQPRNFISLGLNFSAPLRGGLKERGELEAINTQLNHTSTEEINTIKAHNQYYLLNLLYEYRTKLKNYLVLLEKRKEQEERIRIESVKEKQGDLEFNPNTAIYILDDYWSNTVELLEIHQQMFRILLNIQEQVPAIDLSHFMTPLSYTQTSAQVPEQGERYLYIWSKTLEKHTTSFIYDYIHLNQFTDLLVSYKNDKDYLKTLNSFASTLHKQTTVQVHLMLGQNKLLYGGVKELLDSLQSGVNLKIIKGIHLDIEPHTQSGFKDNKEKYFQLYLQLVNTVSAFCNENNLSLSVSIPLHYPEEVILPVFKLCRRVMLMAYENVDPDFISKKTKEETSISSEKTVLALRAKDFSSRDQQEIVFKKIGIKHKAYHDMETLLVLDRESSHLPEPSPVDIKQQKPSENKK